MYRHFGIAAQRGSLPIADAGATAVARSGQLDALVALERVGGRLSFARNQEIYAEGGAADCWYKVVSGVVRVCKLLADGRRHIAEFCFGGDWFGRDGAGERLFSAEALGAVIVMRYPCKLADQLIDEHLSLARGVRDAMLRELANAHGRMLVLGRMTAPERVAAFIIEMADRQDADHCVELPMSRNDIADYLGLTIETVCRVLSAFKRSGAIGIPSPHRIDLRDRDTLATISEG